MSEPTYRKELGNNLVLRWSTAEDVEALAQLVSSVFRSNEEAPPNAELGYLMNELMSGSNPAMDAGDFALVEDTDKKALVACTCLWRQDWEYEGIRFPIGRPEIVATDAAYRNRGLIRAVFELIHARSKKEEHLVQAITGIAYFYRQFEYEYALDLGGGCTIKTALIPKAEEGVPEPFTLRDATLADIPSLQRLYDRQRTPSIVSTPVEEVWWSYYIQNWSTSRTGDKWHVQMIVDPTGTTQGYLTLPTIRWDQDMQVVDMTFAPGVNVQAAITPILRALHTQGLQMPTKSDAKPMNGIALGLGSKHPVYDALSRELASSFRAPYAWYVRVPDLPGFIQHITTALEQRLENSLIAGYSGELKLDFFRSGLRLVFDRGRLTVAENWRSPVWNANVDASFPPLVFLQLLFGFRSLDELRYAFPDVRLKDEAILVLKSLFPARPSWVMPLG